MKLAAASIAICIFVSFCSPANAYDGRVGCIVEDAFACKTRDLMDQMLEYRSDPVAFKAWLLLAVASGNCRTISLGKKVYIEDTAIFAQMRKVRVEGELIGFWTAESLMSQDQIKCAAAAGTAEALARAPVAQQPLVSGQWLPSKTKVSVSPMSAPVAKPSEPNCEIKPVMTDDDMAKCRK